MNGITQRHFRTNRQSFEPRVVLYSHDTMGLGHLRRNLLIASVLSQTPINANVLVVSGAREACYFATKSGVDSVVLPSLCKDHDGNYSGKHLRMTCEQTTQLRSKIIASTLDAFSPHVFIVDKVARGIGNELDASLAAIRTRGRTRCVLGLREILDDPATVMRQWKQCAMEDAIREYYDEVWIYGDPMVYDSVRQYSFVGSTVQRSRYIGYLDQSRRLSDISDLVPAAAEGGKLAVCVVGGGQDGASLASAFASARMPGGWKGILITGPFLPEIDRIALRQSVAGDSDCILIENLVEADQYIANADKVVSMAGYNTITSILSFQKPALVVPRVSPRREQWIRASRFAAQGQLTMLEPDDLSSAAISSWLERLDVPTPNAGAVDISGLDRIVERVQQWFPSTGSVSTLSSEVSVV